MQTKNHKTTDWFHFGASGILQPLSEEFLYRSSEQLESHCWRKKACAENTKKGKNQHV